MIYRASKDGFSSENFHSLCDNKDKTLGIIKTESYGEVRRCGWFTDIKWASSGGKVAGCGKSFLFLILKDDVNITRLKCI